MKVHCTTLVHSLSLLVYYCFISYHVTIDINECEMETDNCNENANCTDTIGSFNCTCNPGYDGDGVNCSSEFCFLLKS